MEAASSSSSSSSSSSILSSRLLHRPTRYPLGPTRLRLPKSPLTVGSASKREDGYGWDFGGGLVDENMVVLRKRIHEMRVEERGNPDPPSDWMQWEKNYYAYYGTDVCDAVGLIQILLMSMRPSVAVGLVGLLILSMPTGVILIGLHLMEALRSVLN